jgi:hypothetical protein
MPFEPDFIVTGPDPSEVALVVEAKASNRVPDEAKNQLKDYMRSLRSPVGLIVTLDRILLYRDAYLPSAEQSIKEVGDFETPGILRRDTARQPVLESLAFERRVQSWLEGLSTESGIRSLTPEFRRAAELYLVPALQQGVVRSTHPRPHVNA